MTDNGTDDEAITNFETYFRTLKKNKLYNWVNVN